MVESDRDLVERVRGGDRDAFGDLVRRYLRAAYAVALAGTGDPVDAEDVCQDAFVVALERIDSLRDGGHFAAWLLRIVRNQAHNRRRAERVRQAGPLAEAGGVAGPADTARAAELSRVRERLLEALEGLPARQREVLLLHDLDGWKHREIAEALGVPEGTIRAQLSYARRAVRRFLGVTSQEEV